MNDYGRRELVRAIHQSEDSEEYQERTREIKRRIWKMRLQSAGMFLVAALFIYTAVCWQWFAVRHPKAGDGAFFVYFKEVVTWGTVEDLQ